MKMIKNGFTMIELIFVIVILGILAAVAIPKMQGVKDDAQLANANENFCVNLKGPFMSYSVRHNNSLVGFDFTQYSDAVDGTTWTMTQGGDKTNLVAGDINAITASSLKATVGNSSNHVYVYLIDGNTSDFYSCLVSGKATSSKSASTARNMILSGSNYL